MIIFSWNARGAAGPSFAKTLKEYTQQFKPDLVAIQETKCGGEVAKRSIQNCGFNFHLTVDAQGFSGGIWLLWNNPNFHIQEISRHNQALHVQIENGMEHWNLTVVYASPQETKRREIRSFISDIADTVQGPWLLCGDFNDIGRIDEKKGGAPPDKAQIRRFTEWIDRCSLIDLGFNGTKFTWRGPVWQNGERIFKRLDRALCNVDWRLRFQEAVVDTLPRVRSDHHPILIKCKGTHNHPREKPFRFEFMWMQHHDFQPFIRQAWLGNHHLTSAISSFVEKIKLWNRDNFGHLFKQKRTILNRLRSIQNSPRYGKSEFLDSLEERLNGELEAILDREQTFWLQKSRENWIVEGDRNTRYYHTKTIIRRRRNKILKLRDDSGVWMEDHEALKSHVCQYFQNLFQDKYPRRNSVINTTTFYPPMEDGEIHNLSQFVNKKEIEDAIFAMGSLKAPGDDGLPAGFFKENWQVVGSSVINFVLDSWRNPSGIKDVNNTLLTLIPKVDHPEFVNQFRPISLCNVSYKTITKILANRIKTTLNNRISPAQSSFIPGRKIQDNIIIAHEIIHSMRKSAAKHGHMAIKIDLEKAYDRLSWNFIERCLQDYSIPPELISVIMNCIRSTSFQVLWNGEKTNVFSPTCGIRQGDPLSPYIFVICIDRLSHLIEDMVNEGQWIPFRVGRNGPLISHLMFADDIMLFAEASQGQIRNIKKCLEIFCEASGQVINAQKTQIFFSKKVNNECREMIVKEAGYKETKEIGRYLGSYIVEGRDSKRNYGHILDKVKNKLKGWKQKSLSIAGRVVLAQSSIGPIANFAMQHSKLPKGICSKVEKAQRNFVWGSDENHRRVHLISWETLCLPKDAGGLGFKRLEVMNQAFLFKICWNLNEDPDTLWARVLWYKYCNGDTNRPHNPTVGCSNLWRALQQVWPTFEENIVHRIGNGENTKFWKDKWLNMDGCLADHIRPNVQIEDMDASAQNYVNSEGEWNLEVLNSVIETECIPLIKAIPAPRPSDPPDSRAWKNSSDGRFSVREAYKAIIQPPIGTSNVWKKIWKWHGPQRIKIFMWQAIHGRLITNYRRSKWYGTSPLCHYCTNQVEDTMHVLRDCEGAKVIWKKLVRSELALEFFSIPTSDWFHECLNKDWGCSIQAEWISIYMVACWRIWNWRNMEIFQRSFKRPVVAYNLIQDYVNTIQKAFEKYLVGTNTHRRMTISIKWQPPQSNWIKINTDGAVKDNPRRAGCGGILRNSEGRWIMGFSRNLGVCSAHLAELWGVYTGLEIAWTMGFRRIWLDCDSSAVVNSVKNPSLKRNSGSVLYYRISELLDRGWQVRIEHVYREANGCADFLANLGAAQEQSLMVWNSPPPGSDLWVLSDITGTSWPRMINLV
ncbi:hypothetical protein AHAS_Ahas17G0046200 [Arachis hypogaea]